MADQNSAHRTIQRALRFRLEPTDEQHARLLRFAGARRWAWNWALGQRTQHYMQTGKTLSVTELCTRLTRFKRTEEGAWLNEIDSQLPQQAFRDLHNAFEAFFAKRARFPRFKSRKRDHPRFRTPQRVRLHGCQVYVPGIGWILIRKSREAIGELGSVTCTQQPDGHWYVSITETITVEALPPATPRPERILGVDAGLKDLLVAHEGWRVPCPRWFRRSARKLRRANQALSRTQRGSRGREHARQRLAGAHACTHAEPAQQLPSPTDFGARRLVRRLLPGNA